MTRNRLPRDDEFLTTQETMEFLKISRQSLFELRKMGKGPPTVRLGDRKLRYRKSKLLEWAEQHESVEGPKAA